MILLLSLLSVASARPNFCNTSPPSTATYAVVSGKSVYGAIDPTPGNPRSGDEYIGICTYAGGAWTLKDVPTCTHASPTTTWLGISDDGGVLDSTVGPVTSPGGKVCKDTRPGKGGVAITLHPFADSFAFGLWYTGYCGRDKVYGTSYDDSIYTHSEPSAGSALPPYAKYNSGGVDSPCPAMTGPEVACGYEGDDLIVTQNSDLGAYGVCVDAGDEAGAEYDDCYVASTTAIDSALGCEYLPNMAGFPCDCDCGDEPSDAFFPDYKP